MLQPEEIAERLWHIYDVQGSVRDHYESHDRYVDGIAIFVHVKVKLS
jgi:hypothetical protein